MVVVAIAVFALLLLLLVPLILHCLRVETKHDTRVDIKYKGTNISLFTAFRPEGGDCPVTSLTIVNYQLSLKTMISYNHH